MRVSAPSSKDQRQAPDRARVDDRDRGTVCSSTLEPLGKRIRAAAEFITSRPIDSSGVVSQCPKRNEDGLSKRSIVERPRSLKRPAIPGPHFGVRAPSKVSAWRAIVLIQDRVWTFTTSTVEFTIEQSGSTRVPRPAERPETLDRSLPTVGARRTPWSTRGSPGRSSVVERLPGGTATQPRHATASPMRARLG